MFKRKARVRTSTLAAYSAACLIAGGLIFAVGSSFADNDTSTQSVLGSDLIMPYDGYLMIDSSPVTGVRTIKFDLYQSDDAAALSVWSETQTVEIYNGRFSVGLGSSTSLTSTILDAEKLFLGMTIIENDAQGNAVSVELSGRQAIEPAPFAAWSGNSADFNVRGALTVEGATTINDDVSITGSDNDGTLSALSITSNSSQTMLIDGNEIDALNNSLYLQNNSKNSTIVVGALQTQGNVTLGNGTGDTTTTSGTLVASQGIELGNDQDIYNVDIINGYNDIRWRANSGDTADDMKLESDGDLAVYNDLTVSGAMHSNGNLSTNGDTTLGNGSGDDTSISGDLTVSGDITNFTMEGEYRAKHSNSGSGYNNRSGSECLNNARTDNASCSNSSNGGDISMGSSTNRICFLTRVKFEDLHDSNNNGRCEVLVDGSTWRLRASSTDGQPEVWCSARCLSW